MILFSPRQVRRAFCAVCCFACLVFAPRAAASLPRQSAPAPQDSARQSRESGPPLRIPRQQAQTTAAIDGVVRDAGFSNIILPVPAAALTLRNVQSGEIFSATTSGEGVFRVFPLPPGQYQLRVEAKDYAPFVLPDLALQPNEVLTLEISLVTVAAMEARSRLPRLPELGPALSAEAQPSFGTHRELRHRLDSDPTFIENISRDTLPSSRTFTTPFQTAGPSSSLITAATRRKASTFTPSLAGTIPSIAIVSKATSPFGPR